MIRTLIEISSDTTWDHNRQLQDTLDKLGFEPKRSEEYGRFMSALMQELQDRGLNPQKLVEDRQTRLSAEARKSEESSEMTP